ncbi:MAG: hypothetical protein U0790_22470 [Isosphaeraceae bacterium]
MHLADPDGSNDVCLTEGVPSLPRKHIGSPSWHPTGRYLVVVVEKARHAGTSVEATPGFGGYTDIWCLTPDGRRAFQLTDLPGSPDEGVICPRFSPDGKRLVWAGRLQRPNFLDPKMAFGRWAIMVGDFVDAGEKPRLRNIRSFQPGGAAFYETYGLSVDGKRIIFCSSMNQRSVWDQQIYTISSTTGRDVRQLTHGDYNEHAFYTPDGKSIVWMTNRGSIRGGADWWIMRSDGSGKRRLTHFNQPGHEHDMGRAVWAGLGSFSPEGRRFVGDIQTNLLTQDATIRIVELIPEKPGRGGPGAGRPGSVAPKRVDRIQKRSLDRGQ